MLSMCGICDNKVDLTWLTWLDFPSQCKLTWFDRFPVSFFFLLILFFWLTLSPIFKMVNIFTEKHKCDDLGSIEISFLDLFWSCDPDWFRITRSNRKAQAFLFGIYVNRCSSSYWPQSARHRPSHPPLWSTYFGIISIFSPAAIDPEKKMRQSLWL